MMSRSSAAIVLFLLFSTACTLARPLDDLTAAPSDHCEQDSDCRDARCIEAEQACRACPPTMSLSRFADGTAFCIDRLEVSQREYESFLESVAAPSPALAPGAHCDGNRSYWPDEPGIDACAGSFRPVETPNHPVVCVDMCDAIGYCAWAGKRLCSARGGDPIVPVQVDDARFDEWFVACTDGRGDRKYPYGGEFAPGVCNANGTSLSDVGSFADCHTESGLFDLSGNAAEWIAGCIESNGDWRCLTRGGSFQSQSPTDVACLHPADLDATPTDPLGVPPMDRRPTLGFRCCLD